MKTSTIILLSFAFSLLQCFAVVSSKGVPSLILASGRSISNSLLKQSVGDAVYNDQDVKDLILHNLGMLDLNNKLSDSTQSLISQYGNRNFFKQQKLNYVFLLEGASPQRSVQTELNNLENPQAEHQPVLVDVCSSEDSSKCLLSQLFSREDESSVVSSLIKSAKTDKLDAYLYSSSSKVSSNFPKSTLVSAVGKNGDIYLMEHNKSGKFRVSSNLEACVNSALKSKYTVNIQKRTVTTKSGKSLVVPESAKTDFLQFMTDICSIVGTSTLIRKDPNPSFFVFHITSLGKLEQALPENQESELYDMFNVAYDQFVSKVLSRYTRAEVSGQILFVSSENNIKEIEQQDELWSRHPWERILAEEGQVTSNVTQSTDTTTPIIFGSVLVAFALITAWVAIQMFSIDVQKDSVVYAKFLAGDYFRR